MKKKLFLLLILVFLSSAGFCLAAQDNNLKDYLLETLKKLNSKAAISETSADIAIFSATEIVTNDLSDAKNPFIEFWAAAFCPNSGNKYAYKIPAGYKLASCSYGSIGSHKGCSNCVMVKIKLTKENILVNGSCGTANGQSLTVIPASNLCSAGTASVVSGSGPWTWTCVGSNGGTTAGCSTASIGQSEIRLIYPNGGEVFKVGQIVKIKWTLSNAYSGDAVKIYIDIKDVDSNNSGLTNSINEQEVLASQGYYDWVVDEKQLPYGSTLPHKYNLRIVGVQKNIYDFSDADFIIEKSERYVDITSPNGGESFCLNDEVTIKWDSKGISNVQLWLSMLNGSDYNIGEFSAIENNGTESGLTWKAGEMLGARAGSYKLEGSSKLIVKSSWEQGKEEVRDETGYFSLNNCLVDGVCGLANNSTLTEISTSNLCSAGTASVVSGSGPWTWTCNGIKGGKIVSCSANRGGETNNPNISKPLPCGTYGDINNDGKITYADVERAYYDYKNLSLGVVDVNGNRAADLGDAVMIYNYLDGKITNFEVCTSKPLPCGTYGDINNDGKITYADVERAYYDYKNLSLGVVDVNNNKEADFLDVIAIYNYLKGNITTFSVCKWALKGSVAEYSFDEGTGTTIKDNWGLNHGTIYNGSAFASGSSCISGHCLSFDGVDDYVLIPNSALLSSFSQNMSVFLWVKADGQASKHIIGQYSPGQKAWTITTGLADGQEKRIKVSLSQDGISYISSITTIDVLDSNWHFIGFTLENKVLTVYVDGQKIMAVGNSTTSIYRSSNPLTVGGVNGGTSFFRGAIDEVKIFNKALSEDEVKELYSSR